MWLGFFVRETGYSLLDTRKMVNGYQVTRKSGCRLHSFDGAGVMELYAGR
jgi:hypothetical protein